MASVLYHEMSHTVEANKGIFKDFKTLIKDVFGEKYYDAKMKELSEIYSNISGVDLESEVIASLFSELMSMNTLGEIFKGRLSNVDVETLNWINEHKIQDLMYNSENLLDRIKNPDTREVVLEFANKLLIISDLFYMGLSDAGI